MSSQHLHSYLDFCEGIPLRPTLGSPARSLSEVYTLLNGREFTAEYKYDGQRAQIHASKLVDGTVNVHIFSRHLEDMTTKASLEAPYKVKITLDVTLSIRTLLP